MRLAYFDEYYVHIDLMVVPIAPKLTAVCLDCTEPGIVQWLKNMGHEIIDVPFPDTMTLGCNFMSLGKDRVIAPRSSQTLIKQLKARGFDVVEVEMAELSKTGGGIHCMARRCAVCRMMRTLACCALLLFVGACATESKQSTTVDAAFACDGARGFR